MSHWKGQNICPLSLYVTALWCTELFTLQLHLEKAGGNFWKQSEVTDSQRENLRQDGKGIVLVQDLKTHRCIFLLALVAKDFFLEVDRRKNRLQGESERSHHPGAFRCCIT